MPSSYSFVNANNLQTDVNLLKKFGNWNYSEDGDTLSVHRRMPWLCNCHDIFLTTDDGIISNFWYGCLVQEHNTMYGLGPLVKRFDPTETLYYWMRENRTGK